MKLSRQQKRQQSREAAKQLIQEATGESTYKVDPNDFVTKQQFNQLIQDMQKILNYLKTVDTHSFMLMETLSRMNITNWNDLKDTEKLVQESKKRRQEKIKELLAKDLMVAEYLDAIKEDDSVPKHLRLNINPVKDLNLNPYEVAQELMERNPELSPEGYIALGNAWGITSQHFGFSTSK